MLLLLDWFGLIFERAAIYWLDIIITHLSLYVWNVNIRQLLGDFIRSTLVRSCLGVLEGVITRQVETPCLCVRNTRSGLWKRKVSRRLINQVSGVYLYSSYTFVSAHLS